MPELVSVSMVPVTVLLIPIKLSRAEIVPELVRVVMMPLLEIPYPFASPEIVPELFKVLIVPPRKFVMP